MFFWLIHDPNGTMNIFSFVAQTATLGNNVFDRLYGGTPEPV